MNVNRTWGLVVKWAPIDIMSWQVGGTFFCSCCQVGIRNKNLEMRVYLSLKLKWCEWLGNGIIKSLFLSSFPLVCLLLYVKNMVIHTVSPHNPLIFPLSFRKLVSCYHTVCGWIFFSSSLRRNFLKCLSCPINYAVLLLKHIIFKYLNEMCFHILNLALTSCFVGKHIKL